MIQKSGNEPQKLLNPRKNIFLYTSKPSEQVSMSIHYVANYMNITKKYIANYMCITKKIWQII